MEYSAVAALVELGCVGAMTTMKTDIGTALGKVGSTLNSSIP